MRYAVLIEHMPAGPGWTASWQIPGTSARSPATATSPQRAYSELVTGRRRASALRGFIVLSAVVGVLAMHGFATGHHGPSALPASQVTALSAPLEQAADHMHTATAHVHQLLTQSEHGCDGCQDAPGVFILCVAVLLAAAAGALWLTFGRRALAVPGTRPPSATHPRSLAPPRRPNIVAELCISRT